MTIPAPNKSLKAPFPYFGGKRRVADTVWARFGDVQHYVEPFCGSAAMLLCRPHAPRLETINDIDCYVANFWRALAADPDEVARWANHPINEADMHARHRWLLTSDASEEFRAEMHADPDHYDAKIAGWWVWGACCWIGAGWCAPGREESSQLPSLSGGDRGVHRVSLGGGCVGDNILAYMRDLSARLRCVRVACGDWQRILKSNISDNRGTTGIFLDPPYGVTDRSDVYACESAIVAGGARAWAIAHGDDTRLRIALCGYDGEHDMPAGWECFAWRAHGGYAHQSKNGANGLVNASRERIWFSPHCLTGATAETTALFTTAQ
jgi:DNA adenine methylase